MVEGARLESVYSGNAIAGSNPALSANKHRCPNGHFFIREQMSLELVLDFHAFSSMPTPSEYYTAHRVLRVRQLYESPISGKVL